jgi:hypothetical protein
VLGGRMRGVVRLLERVLWTWTWLRKGWAIGGQLTVFDTVVSSCNYQQPN